MVSPYFDVTGSASDMRASIKKAKMYCEYASILKAPLLRTFTGFMGSDEADDSTWTEAIARLRFLCDIVSEHDIELALETHPKTLVDSVPSVLRLIKGVERQNLVLNLDIYHMWEKHQDPVWIWEQLKPHVRHVHAKNAIIPPSNGDEYPLLHDKKGLQEIEGVTYLDRGNMDYSSFVTCLTRDSFNGWVSLEWFGEDPWTAAEHELNWLKNKVSLANS